MKALVITVSDRASDGVYEDRTGPIIAAELEALGCSVERLVVPDGPPVGEALAAQLPRGFDVVITTGGTGIAPRDETPEQTAPFLDKQLPQLAAQIAQVGLSKGVVAAGLSRGLVGVAGRTVVVNLPGSRGGARDGMEVLRGVLVHAVDQLNGRGDHGSA